MITIGICDDDVKLLSQLEKTIEEKFPDMAVKIFAR